MRWCAPALLCFVLPLAAQTPCATCGDTGVVACKTCASELEADVVVCSVVATCKTCKGSGVAACPACGNAKGAKDVARRSDLATQWRRERTAASKALAAPKDVLQCRSAHFDVAIVGRPSGSELEAHRQLHRIAARLEAARTRLLAATGTTALLANATGLQVALAKDDVAVAQLAEDFTGIEPHGQGAMRLGEVGALVVHVDKEVADEATLHRLLVHGTALLLLAQLPPAGALDDNGWGFLAAGLAHWLEAEQGEGQCTSFCHLDRPLPPLRCFGGDWRAGAAELLANNRLPSLRAIAGADLSALTPEQHVLAFALVDEVLQPQVATGGVVVEPRIAKLLAAAKQGSEPEKACKDVLGLDLAGLDGRLREFVRAHYGGR